jgi:hypothetical protein
MSALVEYRLAQASETLDAAMELLRSAHLRDAVNRGYYSMFYAALALLAIRSLGSSKHSGAMAMLNKHFVNTGIFPIDEARNLRRAFELRQKCDYREFAVPEQAQVQEVLRDAERFLAAAANTAAQLLADLNADDSGTQSPADV